MPPPQPPCTWFTDCSMVLSFDGTSREFITNLVSEPVYTTAPSTHFVFRST